MRYDQADELRDALKAFIEMVNKEPVPDDILRLAMELNHLLERQKTR